jgi:hypothetical protein
VTQEQQLDERTKGILQECRELITEDIPALKECIREIRLQTISSPKLDGMPHGSTTGDAMTNKIKRLERYESDLKCNLRRLERLQSAAKRAVRGLEARRRIFYESYYICGEKAAVARMEAGIAERTASKYIADVRAKKETGD